MRCKHRLPSLTKKEKEKEKGVIEENGNFGIILPLFITFAV